MSLINTCTHCGELFTPKRTREANKFCSRACYFAELSDKGRPHQIAETTQFQCAKCEKPFTFTAGELRAYQKQWGKDPKYCSRLCSHEGRTSVTTRPCAFCGAEFTTGGHSLNRTQTCSDPCRRALQRRNLIERNERERPSESREIQRKLTKDGYIMLRFPNKNGEKGREVFEHRYVMEQHLGRELRPEETVHHKVKPNTKNELDNLELFSSRHGPGQRVDEQLDWALKLLEDYADLVAQRGLELRRLTPAEPIDGLFSALATGMS